MELAMNSTTIVTALFDIGRDKWEHYQLNKSMYLGWYKNTLSLKSNHIIFTDDVYYDEISKILKEHGTSPNVIVIKKSLTELEAYQRYYDRLNKLMMSDEFQKKVAFKVPEMLYPLYNIIMLNKVFFLKEAMNLNPFGSSRFIWADAGGLRERNDLYKGVEWPNEEKIAQVDPKKVWFFCHHPKISIHNKESHSLSQMRFIQGTSFFLTKDTIDPFIQLIDDVVEECLRDGYIGSDEKVFDLCYLRNPDLFHLEVSTWREYFDRYK
jgi:protein YibB